VEIIRSGDKALEKAIDELLIVYTQDQPAYMEMAAHVPIVKLVRLGKKLHLTEFLELLGENKERTRAIIFDDVSVQRYFIL
jgi:hypothetical protein